MAVDFMQFFAQFAIAGFLWHLIILKLPDNSPWRSAMAFVN